MSRLTLLVFLVALTAISIVHSRGRRWKPCQQRVGINPRRGGWGGKCFKKWTTLYDSPKCDALIYDRSINGCPGRRPACCVTACSKQTPPCNRKYRGSYGKCVCECSNERKIGEVRPGSGCNCCKICRRKRRCRKLGGTCITREDPHFNLTWCGDWPIAKKACHGWGCWCCYPPKIG